MATKYQRKQSKAIMLFVIGIMLITNTYASVTMNWQSPNVDGEYVAGYPTSIRAVIMSTKNLTSCDISVDGIQYTKILDRGYSQITLEKKVKLIEGSHNATINCTNENSESVQQTKTFNTNAMMNFQEDNTNITTLIILGILYLLLIIVHIALRKEDTYMLLVSGFMLLISYYATTINDAVYMWIPIVIALIWVLDDSLVALGFKGKSR